MAYSQQYFNRHKIFHTSPGYASDLTKLYKKNEIWNFWARSIQKAQQFENFTVHSFVLMSTHVHLLFSSLEANENFVISQIEKQLKCQLELSLDQNIFDEPILCQPISSYKQLLHTYRYIYRNPIEAGLCFKAEDYTYSTLREILDRPNPFNLLSIQAIDPLAIIQNPMKLLNWINNQNETFLY